MHVALRYFSGTGNSFKIMETCMGIFNQGGCTTTLSAITDRYAQEEDPDLLGFCFPVYAFGIPRICRKYLLSLLKVQKPTNAFVLITAGAPDEAGFSVAESVKIMKDKGLNVLYDDVVHMPANWTVAMNPPAKEEAQRIINLGVAKAEIIARDILNGVQHHHVFKYPARLSKFGFYKDFYLFKWFGVSNLWRNFRADETCNGCQLCEKICPTGSIHMAGDKPKWAKSCEQCMRCVNYCPKKAIFQTDHGSIKGKNIYFEPSFRPLKIVKNENYSTSPHSSTPQGLKAHRTSGQEGLSDEKS